MNKDLQTFIANHFSVPGRALDLGAGDFHDVNALIELGWKAVGVDKTTGVDLNDLYEDPRMSFNLVYSNFVIHKLLHPEKLVETAYENLDTNGWFFLQTFHKSDTISSSRLDEETIAGRLDSIGFKNSTIEVLNIYDNDPGHGHWHRVLMASAQKVAKECYS